MPIQANTAVMPIPVPREKMAELRALSQPTALSLPTFFMWLFAMAGVVAADIFAISGELPYWAGCLLNVVFMYPLFGVIHDASHRSISSIKWLNDWMGRLGLLILLPGASLGMFRWAHMQHHRFTNGTKDPDRYMHGPWWSLPLRWMTLDVGYLYFLAFKSDAVGRKYLLPTLLAMVGNVVVATGLVYAGYGSAVLLLWLIPSRITLLNFGFVFFWLPHTLEGVKAEDNLTLASNMRLGHEWLMHPLCQFHNYHLMHHLYPSTPPYNHPKIWKLMEDEIRQRDLAVQKGFAIYPEIQYGPVADEPRKLRYA